jgi:uncharacterized membrane protein
MSAVETAKNLVKSGKFSNSIAVITVLLYFSLVNHVASDLDNYLEESFIIVIVATSGYIIVKIFEMSTDGSGLLATALKKQLHLDMNLEKVPVHDIQKHSKN